MKTSSFLKRPCYVLACLFALLPCLLTAQDYSFQSPVLESGTALQTGAVYRFSNVKTGIDALVTVSFITPGCTLSRIDNDGGTGYLAAFQPELLAPAHTTGYVEFHIEFVAAGTSTPMIMAEIPATAIDIDGNNSLWGGPLNEYDAISMGGASYVDYNLLGNQLSVTYSPGWVQAVNSGGTEFGGINISATSVMITTVNAGLSSFDYRTGVNNQSNISTLYRQKSLYFAKFTYPNSALSQTPGTIIASIQRDNENNTDRIPEIFPTVIHSNAILHVTAGKNNQVKLSLFHPNGKEVLRKVFTADEGTNHFSFTIDKHLPAGVYIAMININGKVNSKKVVLQQ